MFSTRVFTLSELIPYKNPFAKISLLPVLLIKPLNVTFSSTIVGDKVSTTGITKKLSSGKLNVTTEAGPAQTNPKKVPVSVNTASFIIPLPTSALEYEYTPNVRLATLSVGLQLSTSEISITYIKQLVLKSKR